VVAFFDFAGVDAVLDLAVDPVCAPQTNTAKKAAAPNTVAVQPPRLTLFIADSSARVTSIRLLSLLYAESAPRVPAKLWRKLQGFSFGYFFLQNGSGSAADS
jgi:hypothetical protein